MVRRRSFECKPGYGIESGRAFSRSSTASPSQGSGVERVRCGDSETIYRKLDNERVLNVSIHQESVVNTLDAMQYRVLSWQYRLRMARVWCHAN